MSVQDLLNYEALQGGKDTSAITADANGNVIELLKHLIDTIVGATNISPSADTNGSMAERVAWLQANGGGSWSKLSPATTAYPGLYGPFAYGRWSLSGSANLLGVCCAPSWSVGTIAIDTTRKARYYRNNNGSATYVRVDDISLGILPTGPGGAFAAFDALNQGLVLPPTDLTVFVTEFEFAWPTAAAALNDDRGMGLSDGPPGSSAWATGAKHFHFYRKSGSGWTVGSSDGSTRSETSEASDTSDGSRHIARLEWDTTPAVRLYIDGVLKVTKTTNLPPQDASIYIRYFGWSAAAADASDSQRLYALMAYWRAS